jgi:hypothetical protein
MGFSSVVAQEDLPKGFAPVGYVAMDEHAMLEPLRAFVTSTPEPFFLTVLTSVPHHPYATPRGAPAPEGSAEAYAHAIRHVDDFVGAVRAALQDSGHLDQITLLVVGDHGEAFGEHGRLQHDSVPWDEVTRVPLLLRGPGIVPGTRIAGLRSQLDVLPTLLARLGVAWEGRVAGTDLLGDPEGHDVLDLRCWYEDFCLARVEPHRKYVHHFGRRADEVFDLREDPSELRALDLADETHRTAARQMLSARAAVAALWEQAGAAQPAGARQAGASETPPPPLVRRRPQCMRSCVADLDPAREGLQWECQAREVDPDGASRSFGPCDPAEPAAQDCLVGRSDAALPRECADAGFNLELGLRRSSPAAHGSVLDVQCRLSERPERDCAPERLGRPSPAPPPAH